MSGFIHFAIGGSRSGKSRRAESLAIATGQAVAYLATYAADPPDDEMRRRIERHRQQRPLDWRTIENRQMLGESVRDPQGVADDRGILPGLNILPVQTTFSPTKSVSQVTVSWGADRWVAYQVHMGVTTRTQRCDELVLTVNGQGNEREGCRQNHVWGSYLHGLFESPAVRSELAAIAGLRNYRPALVAWRAHLERIYVGMAEALERYLNLEGVWKYVAG